MGINYAVRVFIIFFYIVLALVVVQAVPLPALHQVSFNDPSDLMMSRYGEPLVQDPFRSFENSKERIVLQAKQEDGFDDNQGGKVVLEGFDEGSGEDCDKLPYGPTTKAGQDPLTASFCDPIALIIILFLL
ncbi:uncharacterized protein LOC108045090 [Drosophila rhopaloa]|uniref:Uncharacterized protein LOC108045090 n=1 Tax=Drosophila rhopaloa TaxID=1041015 RepID=A0A6P4ENI3_DRORH|nr:uncharacterized protein LOC108045090 [Drosophila rhopaloa]